MYRKIAFVTEKNVILANGEAKILNLPEFKKNFDTDMVIGKPYTKPTPRSIQASELSMTIKDYSQNEPLANFIEDAFNKNLMVTLMMLQAEQSTPSLATSRTEFYLGYTNKPGRNVTPDKADESTLTMQVADSWRIRNGVVVWRLPTGGSDDNITIEAVYG